MSSPSFDATIDLKLKPSMRGLQWVFVLHILPVGILPLAIKPGPVLAAVVGAFALSWLYLRRHPAIGFGPRGLKRLVWNADGTWLVEDNEGRKSQAALLPTTYVHPRLMVLNLSLNSGGRRTRMILGDEAPPEILGRLRARLLNAPRS
jgi:toxin CptA